jgi:hypothetical protein
MACPFAHGGAEYRAYVPDGIITHSSKEMFAFNRTPMTSCPAGFSARDPFVQGQVSF